MNPIKKKLQTIRKPNKFDWKKFHQDLDYAVAQYIIDSPAGIQNIRLPSKTTLMKFMVYSNVKRQEQDGTKPNKKV